MTKGVVGTVASGAQRPRKVALVVVSDSSLERNDADAHALAFATKVRILRFTRGVKSQLAKSKSFRANPSRSSGTRTSTSGPAKKAIIDPTSSSPIVMSNATSSSSNLLGILFSVEQKIRSNNHYSSITAIGKPRKAKMIATTMQRQESKHTYTV